MRKNNSFDHSKQLSCISGETPHGTVLSLNHNPVRIHGMVLTCHASSHPIQNQEIAINLSSVRT